MIIINYPIYVFNYIVISIYASWTISINQAWKIKKFYLYNKSHMHQYYHALFNIDEISFGWYIMFYKIKMNSN